MFFIFTNSTWSYLLWSPVVIRTCTRCLLFFSSSCLLSSTFFSLSFLIVANQTLLIVATQTRGHIHSRLSSPLPTTVLALEGIFIVSKTSTISSLVDSRYTKGVMVRGYISSATNSPRKRLLRHYTKTACVVVFGVLTSPSLNHSRETKIAINRKYLRITPRQLVVLALSPSVICDTFLLPLPAWAGVAHDTSLAMLPRCIDICNALSGSWRKNRVNNEDNKKQN